MGEWQSSWPTHPAIRISMHTSTHTHTHIHTHAHAYKHTHTPSCTPSLSHTHKQTHTHTYEHPYLHTHTDIYTHILLKCWIRLCFLCVYPWPAFFWWVRLPRSLQLLLEFFSRAVNQLTFFKELRVKLTNVDGSLLFVPCQHPQLDVCHAQLVDGLWYSLQHKTRF